MEFLEKLQDLLGSHKSGSFASWDGLNGSELGGDAVQWMEDMTQSEPYRVTQIALAACGVMGNILCIVGWSSNKTWSAAALFLLWLAVFDVMFLTGNTLEVVLRTADVQAAVSAQTYKGLYMSASYISDFGIQGSSLMTVAIATERMLVATKSQRAAMLCHLIRAKIVVVVTVFVCVIRLVIRLLYEIPVAIRDSEATDVQTSSETGNTTNNVNVTSSEQTMFIINYVEWTYIRLVLDITLVYTIPWILLLVFNIVTLVALKRGEWKESVERLFKSKPKKKLFSRIRFEKRLFYAVIALSSVSIVSYPVAIVARLVTSDVRQVFRPLVNILILVKIINSAINFLIYYCINSKFRRAIINACFCMQDDVMKDWRRNCIYY